MSAMIAEDTETLFEKLNGGLNRLLGSEFGLDAAERRDIENSIDLIVTDGPDEHEDELADLAAYLGVKL